MPLSVPGGFHAPAPPKRKLVRSHHAKKGNKDLLRRPFVVPNDRPDRVYAWQQSGPPEIHTRPVRSPSLGVRFESPPTHWSHAPATVSLVAVAQFWHFIPLNPAVLGGWRRWSAVREYGSSGVRRYHLRRPPTTNHCVMVRCRRHHGRRRRLRNLQNSVPRAQLILTVELEKVLNA